MDSGRFETFFDAIVAIAMTVLVLKIPQPYEASFIAIWTLRGMYLTYLVSFLIVFKVWYNNHNIFQLVESVNSRVILFGGIELFFLSLLPYFTNFVALNPFSLLAEVIYGLEFICIHGFFYLSLWELHRCDTKNTKFHKLNAFDNKMNLPIILIIISFLISFLFYTPAVLIACLIAILMWIFLIN